jgi:hypothetical protein
MKTVLLLTSYCEEDKCTDESPCLECLKMCNVVIMSGYIAENLGGWEYNRGLNNA